MIPTEKLREILERAEMATPGRREVIRFDNDGGAIDYQVETEIRQDAEHAVIAHFSEYGNPKNNKGDAELCAALDKETVESIVREPLAWRDVGEELRNCYYVLEQAAGDIAGKLTEKHHTGALLMARAEAAREALRKIEEASK